MQDRSYVVVTYSRIFSTRNSEGIWGGSVTVGSTTASIPEVGSGSSFTVNISFIGAPNTIYGVSCILSIWNQGGSDAGNWSLNSSGNTVNSGDGARLKGQVSVNWSGSSFTYNGTPQGPTATITRAADGGNGSVPGFTPENNTETSAGTYTATSNINDTNDYDLVSGSTFSWSIARAAQAPVSVSNVGFLIGQLLSPSYSGGSGTGGWQFVVSGYTSWDGSASSNTGTLNGGVWSSSWTPPGVGSFSFFVSRNGDTNYTPSSVAGPYTVTAYGVPTVSFASTPASTVPPGTNMVWSASASSPNGITASGIQVHFDLSTDGGVTWSPNAYQTASSPNSNAVTAGAPGTTYKMRAMVSDGTPGSSGGFVSPIIHTVTVAKANQGALTITSASSTVFPTPYSAAALGGSGTGALSWTLGPGSTAPGAAINSSTGVVSFTGAGTVVFNAYRAADSNYNQSASTADFALTVTPKPVTFTVSPTTFAYTSAVQGPTITASDPSATFTTSGTSSATLPGSYSLTATATGNYSGTSGAVPWTITKGTPVVSLTPASPTVAVGSSVTFTASGGQTSYTWAGTAGATGTGSTKVVSFPTLGSYNVTVRDLGNSLWNASNVFSTTVTVVTISTTFAVSPVAFTYTGSPQGTTITPSPGGATYSVTGSTSATAAGSYSLIATASGNFGGSSGPVNWVINPATPVVKIAPGTQTVTQGATLTFTASEGQNAYTWGGSAGATGAGAIKTVTFATPGTYSVTVQSSAGGNYAASNLASVSIAVTPASLFGISGAANYGTVRVYSGSPLTSTVVYTLSNTGGSAYVVSAAGTTGDFSITAINGGTVSFPFTINAGGTAAVSVTFDATAIGARNGSLAITNTSTNTPAYYSALTGFGSEGILSPSWSAVRTQ